MKIRLIFASSLVVAALMSCQCIRKQSKADGSSPVQIDEHSVLIPSTAICEEDREALNTIFRQYDTSLYRVGVYEHGKLKKHIGTLSEMTMEEVVQQYSNNATARGLSNWTNQIGLRTHVTHYGPTTHVTHLGDTTHVTKVGNTTHVTTAGNPSHVTHPGRPNHVTTIAEQSDALVREVTPILEKYSK